jgi:ASC-1-like (ASCH) protein
MNHLVHIDQDENDLDKLKSGQKTMIITCGLCRQPSRDRIHIGDTILFAEKSGNKTCIRGNAKVQNVFVSGKLSREESLNLVESYNNRLMLSTAQKKRYKTKQYLVLVTISNFNEVNTPIDLRLEAMSQNTWIPIKHIENFNQ